jgi:hypothetical protein
MELVPTRVVYEFAFWKSECAYMRMVQLQPLMVSALRASGFRKRRCFGKLACLMRAEFSVNTAANEIETRRLVAIESAASSAQAKRNFRAARRMAAIGDEAKCAR